MSEKIAKFWISFNHRFWAFIGVLCSCFRCLFCCNCVVFNTGKYVFLLVNVFERNMVSFVHIMGKKDILVR